MAEGTAREIDWRTAEVSDGKLTVELRGEGSDDWDERFTGILDRLGRGAQKVSLDDGTIVVDGVTPGSEGDVKHLVESAVLQANSGLESPDDGEGDGDDDDGRSSEDDEMTAAFRAFASD